MIILISLIVCAFCFILRIMPRILWENFNGTDGYFHFYYIDLIKKNNHRLPIEEKRVIGGSNECTYPFFYHWLLSFFPAPFVNFWDKFSGFIFDFLSGVLVTIFLYHGNFLSLHQAFLLLGAYIISPGLTFSFIGPRPYSLTPRNFSQFIFFLGVIFLISSLPASGNISDIHIVHFILSAVFFAFLLLSSQFGTQVLFCLLLAGIYNLQIAISIVLSAFFSILLFNGFFVRQIKAHLRHLEWYFKYNYPFVQQKSNFSALIKHIKNKNMRGVFYECVLYNQIITSFLRHPTYFVSLILGMLALLHGELTSIQINMFLILFTLFLPFVLTNFGKGRVFGEAERYIEFVYPLQIGFFFSLMTKSNMNYILSFFLIYNIMWYLYNLYEIRRQYASQYSYDNLCAYLKDEKINLLCLSNNESYIFLKKTKVNLLGFLVNISIRDQYRSFFEKLFAKYPMVDPKHLSELCEKFNVSHILQNKQNRAGDIYCYYQVIQDLDKYKPIYEDLRYILYEKN